MVVLGVRLGDCGVAIFAALGVLSLSACQDPKQSDLCQVNLKHVSQLIVVLTDTMDSAEAQIAVLQRDVTTPTPSWTLLADPFPGVVGSAGLGWGLGFEDLRQSAEVVKREGDKRSPAGLYPVGSTFGFQAAPWPGHVELKPEIHLCVDDLKSKHYGQIVSRQVAGTETSVEDMASIPVYKRGVFVDYPSNAARKSGSCIFFHIWQSAGEGTAGCIASDEVRIAELQNTSASAKTAVVIWSKSAKARLKKCLPGLPQSLFQTDKAIPSTQDTL